MKEVQFQIESMSEYLQNFLSFNEGGCFIKAQLEVKTIKKSTEVKKVEYLLYFIAQIWCENEIFHFESSSVH